MLSPRKIPVGISQCLLGAPVRYNGGHKLSRVCTEALSKYFDYLPFCPEVAIGMGVPRPPIHLVASDGGPRAQGVGDPHLDVTRQLREYAERVAPQVARLGGFIFMQKSPSCGLHSTPRYRPGDPQAQAHGAGLFAERLRELFPALPVEEAWQLEERPRREEFLARVRAYRAQKWE
ncbi:DUF523 domain-containing protein [Microbulbifer halophilus]|uniref:DUF523 domain-containing protein n=1 Tax=Microbulbifer halophilus TaxID=453963 RepID=A0ABW5E9J6_9GAMM|nr:DUF523 domain-containing protein [Microbulbifer halophilus]MCW8125093.1 DUF523 domain-containing protein [Microbulbifer halophilus]